GRRRSLVLFHKPRKAVLFGAIDAPMQSAVDRRQIAAEARTDRERAVSGREGWRGERTRRGMSLYGSIRRARQRLQHRSFGRCRRRQMAARRNEALRRAWRNRWDVQRRARRE